MGMASLHPLLVSANPLYIYLFIRCQIVLFFCEFFIGFDLLKWCVLCMVLNRCIYLCVGALEEEAVRCDEIYAEGQCNTPNFHYLSRTNVRFHACKRYRVPNVILELKNRFRDGKGSLDSRWDVDGDNDQRQCPGHCRMCQCRDGGSSWKIKQRAVHGGRQCPATMPWALSRCQCRAGVLVAVSDRVLRGSASFSLIYHLRSISLFLQAIFLPSHPNRFPFPKSTTNPPLSSSSSPLKPNHCHHC